LRVLVVEDEPDIRLLARMQLDKREASDVVGEGG